MKSKPFNKMVGSSKMNVKIAVAISSVVAFVSLSRYYNVFPKLSLTKPPWPGVN